MKKMIKLSFHFYGDAERKHGGAGRYCQKKIDKRKFIKLGPMGLRMTKYYLKST